MGQKRAKHKMSIVQKIIHEKRSQPVQSANKQSSIASQTSSAIFIIKLKPSVIAAIPIT